MSGFWTHRFISYLYQLSNFPHLGMSDRPYFQKNILIFENFRFRLFQVFRMISSKKTNLNRKNLPLKDTASVGWPMFATKRITMAASSRTRPCIISDWQTETVFDKKFQCSQMQVANFMRSSL